MGDIWGEDLLDRIYEAAVVPDLWVDVLEDLTRLSKADGALIFTQSGDAHRWIATPNAAEVHQASLDTGWQARNDRGQRLFAAEHAGFLSDLDVYSREEIERHPYFIEFLRPRGYGWGAATAILVPGGDTIAIDVEFAHHRGPVERSVIADLDMLRPHLARSAFVSTRLALERAKSSTLVLDDLLGLPAGVVSIEGRLLAANPRLEALIPSVLLDGADRVALADAGPDALLVEALAGLANGMVSGVRSIAVPVREGRAPTIVHFVPVRRSARDVFSGALALLVMTPLSRAEAPTVELIQGLFDLTPSEAAIARAFGLGDGLDTIARRRGVSRATVRSELQLVFVKTGVAQQSDLGRLLTGFPGRSS